MPPGRGWLTRNFDYGSKRKRTPPTNKGSKNTMAIGKKVGSLDQLKKDLTRSGSSSDRITWVPEDGILVHFLNEVGDWLKYWRYYDPNAKRYVPLDEGEYAPEGMRSQSRYVAEVLDVNTDKVIALDIAYSLAQTLSVISERYGTLLGRDYLIVKSGQGLDTSYQALPEDKVQRPLHTYDRIDLETLLESVRAEALGVVVSSAPAPESKPESRRVASNPDLDDAVFWPSAAGDDTPPVELTDDEMMSMKLPDLKRLAVDTYLVDLSDVTACGRDKEAIVQLIRDAQEV